MRDKAPAQSKQETREETERLIKEAMEKRGLQVKQMKRRIEAQCGKCGAPNRVMAEADEARVSFKCKECGHKQMTL